MRTTIAHGKSRYQQKDSTLWGLASTWEMRLTGPIPRPERTLTLNFSTSTGTSPQEAVVRRTLHRPQSLTLRMDVMPLHPQTLGRSEEVKRLSILGTPRLMPQTKPEAMTKLLESLGLYGVCAPCPAARKSLRASYRLSIKSCERFRFRPTSCSQQLPTPSVESIHLVSGDLRCAWVFRLSAIAPILRQ